ncbi:MAG: hypothetical protein IT287_02525, partial [Bdellovibrionaceae bacterium]|nr:hypothetical protein [Pseudobdellovibrionaceae bacterium]
MNLSLIRNIILATLAAFVLSNCVSPQNAPRSISQVPGAGVCEHNYPQDAFENGFVILDVLEPTRFGKKEGQVINPIMCQKDFDKVRELNLKPFSPIYTFGKAAKPKDKDEPWVGKKLDVRNKEDAEQVAKILQKYVYEGWFEKDKTKGKIDFENHFRENKLRSWCHTPWLNVTEKGREAIHGLTKEFPIRTTSVYTVPEDIAKGEDAVTWGVGFFNKKVCDGYVKFFDQEDMIRQM